MDTVVGILLGLLAVWGVLVAVLWIARPRDVRLAELVRVIPDVLRLIHDLVSDRGSPMQVRLALVGLLAWLLSPIDPIPEFIPVLGPLDHVIVAVIVLRYVRRRVGTDELRRRWRGTDDGFRLLSALLTDS